MAKFAILRTQKLKSRIAIVRSLKHSFRLQETPNADKEREIDNEHLDSTTMKEALSKYEGRLPDKVRKNAVHCIEYLITASPEAMKRKSKDEQDAYFKQSLEWLKNKHGSENVICAGVHRDETTPHMYAYIVPIDDKGKLNCRAFLGGSKALNEMQSDFHQKVALKCGLERGIEGSKAKHTRIQDYYKNISSNDEVLSIDQELFKKKMLESNKKYYERILNMINSIVNKGIDLTIKKLNSSLNKKDIELEKTEKLLKLTKNEKITALMDNTKLHKEIKEYKEYNQRLTSDLSKSVNISHLTNEQREELTQKINLLKEIKWVDKNMNLSKENKEKNQKVAQNISF